MSIEALADELATATTILAFTGAGISTESGIPDFRGPQGIWTTIDPNDFTIERYLADPDHRARVWRMRMEHAAQRYEPNPAHHALVRLERLGILDCVVTQNIDRLHQDAGSTTVLELHGNARETVCWGCGARSPNEPVFARIRAGEVDPRCEDCGGLLKSATISFGEAMPVAETEEAFARAGRCDLCLVVGSSLAVFPAAGVPMAAVEAGARLVIVNQEPTPMDALASVVVRGQAGEVLPAAVVRVESLAGG